MRPKKDVVFDHLNNSARPFINEYKSSLTVFVSTTIATIFWITSSILGSTVIATLALASHIIPAIVYYYRYKPFGIQIEYTPTAVENGVRKVDKQAESRGEAVLRNGQCTIHGLVTLSKTLNSFSLQFDSPTEIAVELRDIPRLEHKYEPDKGVLFCNDVSEFEFTFILNVFLLTESNLPIDDYPLRIIDNQSEKVLTTIRIVHS